jgi:hypothetical protein
MAFPDDVLSPIHWLGPVAAPLAEWGRILTQLLLSERCCRQVYPVFFSDAPFIIYS